METINADKLKKPDERLEEATKTEGESEISDALKARANYLTRSSSAALSEHLRRNDHPARTRSVSGTLAPPARRARGISTLSLWPGNLTEIDALSVPPVSIKGPLKTGREAFPLRQ
ncbi:hypothetical protein C0993_003907 [Termitomyces sp. T159_Od127]|nr:hypothetical protein C0993_003907 [Termitomyces sp. T159_Od127]